MTVETFEFRAEVREILDLVIHSLYSHKEIFLRELISNASDAIDKARFEAQTNPGVLEGEKDFRIEIAVDRAAGTLTIRDGGIGMTREEVVNELGTIAHSGTKEFLKALRAKDQAQGPDLIGQFGVGFYSVFMVADRVTVLTRRAGSAPETGVRWESSADSSYTIQDAVKPTKGTDVTLHLRQEDVKYLDESEIRAIVRKYSDYIEHPIVMDVDRTEDGKQVTRRETLNSRKALWLRDRAGIAPEEYNEFYRHVAHDFSDPAQVVHFKAEGTTEFTALLFVPSREPMGIHYKDFPSGPMLYVRRVQIMRSCEELVPPYLRFVRGVVDSSDLPLNVSREMLQGNRQVEVIRKSITKKVLDSLARMKGEEFEKYAAFHKAMGRVLKEGIHYDAERREQIAELLLFESTDTEPGAYTTLDSYIERMKPGQTAVHYITAAAREAALKSPYIEAFRQKGQEVLFMLDEIDDMVFSGLGEFKGKPLRSVLRGEVELDASAKEEMDRAGEKYSALIGLMRAALGERVRDVRLSGRLTDSPCCLVAGLGEPDARMEHLLRAIGQETRGLKRTLELNPSHPLIESMRRMFETDRENPLLKEYALLLYDQALILQGSIPEDPAAFARTVSRLMADRADRTS